MKVQADPQALSTLTGVDFDTTRSALSILEKFGLIQKETENTLWLPQAEGMVGCETGAASRMRKSRNVAKMKKIIDQNDDVTGSLQTCYEEEEKEKEVEEEGESEREKQRKPVGSAESSESSASPPDEELQLSREEGAKILSDFRRSLPG